jgi:hypothetical protein
VWWSRYSASGGAEEAEAVGIGGGDRQRTWGRRGEARLEVGDGADRWREGREAGGGTGPRGPKGGIGRAGRRKKGWEESGPWAGWGRELGFGFFFFFFKSFLKNFSNPFLNKTFYSFFTNYFIDF